MTSYFIELDILSVLNFKNEQDNSNDTSNDTFDNILIDNFKNNKLYEKHYIGSDELIYNDKTIEKYKPNFHISTPIFRLNKYYKELQGKNNSNSKITVQIDDIICPITHEILKEPVVGDDGHIYEKEALYNWIQKSNISPLTRQPIQNTYIYVHFMTKIINQFIETFPELLKEQYQPSSESSKISNIYKIDKCDDIKININDFLLIPREHQPSGTVNMNRFNNSVVFAQNYNLLRIMDGMSVLSYSDTDSSNGSLM